MGSENFDFTLTGLSGALASANPSVAGDPSLTLGFAGLGFAGYRAARKNAAVA
jgi:hypothetical protein